MQRPQVVPLHGHAPRRHVLVLLISGAGGWIAFDRRLAHALRTSGFDILGLDAQKFFLWRTREPEEVAKFIESLLVSWTKIWNDHHIILIGYSQGADIMPFVSARLHPDWRQRVSLIALLGPAKFADFHLRLRDVIFGTYSGRARPIASELQRLPAHIPVLCIHGRKDKATLCRTCSWNKMHVQPVDGGHIFRHNADEISHIILRAWDRGSNIATPDSSSSGVQHDTHRNGPF
jgi:type IV secretory pathway VirJ component